MARSALQTEIKKRQPFEAPEIEAFVNLLRTEGVLSSQFDDLFEHHGTSGPQYNVLRVLRGARDGGDQALPCLEIAGRMITRVPDITRLVDRLEKMGLVTRKGARDDRRVVLVSISRKGLSLLAQLDRPLAELHRRQLGHLTRRELETLSRLLTKARRSSN